MDLKSFVKGCKITKFSLLGKTIIIKEHFDLEDCENEGISTEVIEGLGLNLVFEAGYEGDYLPSNTTKVYEGLYLSCQDRDMSVDVVSAEEITIDCESEAKIKMGLVDSYKLRFRDGILYDSKVDSAEFLLADSVTKNCVVNSKLSVIKDSEMLGGSLSGFDLYVVDYDKCLPFKTSVKGKCLSVIKKGNYNLDIEKLEELRIDLTDYLKAKNTKVNGYVDTLSYFGSDEELKHFLSSNKSFNFGRVSKVESILGPLNFRFI